MAIDDGMVGRPRRPEGGRRRSGGRALFFWALSLMAGGAAGLLVRWYTARGAAPPPPKLIKIAVAATDLPVGATLQPDHIELQPWPASVEPPAAIQDPQEAVGRVLLTKLVRGELLLDAKLAPRGKGQGLVALIPESMRAVAVRVDDVVGVAGFIHPEDRVDVIVTIKPNKPLNAEPVSKVILQNVKVLAVGQEMDAKDQRGKPLAVTVATLLVSPEESEKLALAAVEGKLLLTLRNWADDRTVETRGSMPTALLGAPEEAPAPVAEERAPRVARPARKPEPVAVAAPVSPAPQGNVVEILRGDRFEERKFAPKEKP